MASVNRVILIGNVGRDPEVKYLPSGDAVATFSLATSERWKGKDGEMKEHTEWHRIEVFGNTAKIVRDYVTKGRQVYIEGQLNTQEWTDKDGNKRSTTKIKVAGFGGRLVLLGGKGEGAAPRSQAAAKSEDFDAPVPVTPIEDEEIPF